MRGQAVALAVQANFFWNVVTSYLFPLANEAIGATWTFAIFAIIDAYALYFVYAHVPETKGLSLEEIEILLGSRVDPALAEVQNQRLSITAGTGKKTDVSESEGVSLHAPLLSVDKETA